MGSEDLTDHGRRIAALERQVAELYKRLGQAQPAFGGGFDSDFEPAAGVTADEDPRLIELIQAGNEIGAIKLYRELTGLGLADSKDAVDRLRATHRSAG